MFGMREINGHEVEYLAHRYECVKCGRRNISIMTFTERDCPGVKGEPDLETPHEPIAYLKVREVAELLRVAPMTIYRLIERGELPAVQIGRSRRIPRSALDAYLAGGGSHYN